jgi:orotidine-5'-phosphate decarboxylase
MKTELVVALDYPNRTEALALVRALDGLPIVYKIGLELFVAEGPSLVHELKEKGCRVFLDLKLYDIPNTVHKAVLSAIELDVDYLTLHLSGGEKMLQLALDALRGKRRPCLLGVSVLTSFSDDEWMDFGEKVSQKPFSVSESVINLAKMAENIGLPGIVCSGHELKALRQEGVSLFTMVPGIRLSEDAAGDQVRVMSPQEAMSLGAGGVVVGRPIANARAPREVAEKYLKELL